MNRKILLTAAIIGMSCASVRAEIRMDVIPAQPVQNEAVHVRVTSQAGDSLVRAVFERDRSQVLALPNNLFSIIPAGNTGSGGDEPVDHTFYLGRLPPGSYSINLGGGTAILKSVNFSVSSSNRGRTIGGAMEAEAPLDHSGMWYIPDQTGSSVVLFHSPISRELGGGVYGYTAAKTPIWFTLAPGAWLNAQLTVYQADIYQSVGSPIAGPYNPSDFAATKVGTARLTFNGIAELVAELTINGVVTTNTYRRFIF